MQYASESPEAIYAQVCKRGCPLATSHNLTSLEMAESTAPANKKAKKADVKKAES
jgi:hypothetical protein